MEKLKQLIISLISMVLCFSLHMGLAQAGGLFLNGVDISSSRNQTLKNVNITISEDGTVFIEAPHYQVREDDIFTSLGKTSKGRFFDKAPGVVGKRGPEHPNSKVDTSTLPTYKEFQNISSKDLKSRKKSENASYEEEEDSDQSRIEAYDKRTKGAKRELQDEANQLSSEEQEIVTSKLDKNTRRNKTTSKNSGNLLRRDEREELSR